MALVQTLSDALHLKVLGWKPSRVPNSVKTTAYNDRPDHIKDLEDRCIPVDLPYPSDLGTVNQVLADALQTLGVSRFERLSELALVDLPDVPACVPIRPGWWVYNKLGWESKNHPPSGLTYIADFETGWTDDDEKPWYPTFGAAWCLENKKWFCWVGNKDNPVSTVPWGRNTTVVGHNIPYDRAYLSSEYAFKDSGNRFFDTMAAWIATRGMCNQMRTAFKATEGGPRPGWVRETTTNGLDAIYRFYTGKELDKGVRDLIVKNGYYWSLDNLQAVGSYGFKDIVSTLEVFQHIYPEWCQHQPSDISRMSQLLMGSYWLPLSRERFPAYYPKAEAAYQTIMDTEAKRLQEIADGLLGQYLPVLVELATRVMKQPKADREAAMAEELGKFYQDLPANLGWLDWTPSLSGKTKGYPDWYRSNYSKLTLKSRITPALFQMTWRGQPILWGRLDKWDMATDGYYTEEYGPIEHPENEGQRCTCLFSKGFEKHVDNGTLASASGLGDTLSAFMSTINWASLRKRVKGIHTESPEGYPVCLPQITVTGTITRRCADSLWQVASNPKKKRIGTELKSMIEAPEGYVLVGADVDAQEARLAGFMGDTQLGYVGSSALSLVVLAGNKKDKTDIHSVAAKSGGVSRTEAKSYLTFGTLYGQGLGGATKGLMKGLPLATKEDCQAKAQAFLSGFKGIRSPNTRRWLGGTASYSFNAMEGIAYSTVPVSPILKAVMPVPLRSARRDYVTTKVNWTIQTSGVDYRDIWVLILTYLYQRYQVDGRVLITIHDELWSMVAEADKYKAVYLFQLASLMTNAYIVDALGLDAIPAACAYHSAVNIDRVCRKGAQGEEYDPCVTPSQPEAIPEGQELSVNDVIDLMDSLDAFQSSKYFKVA